MILIKLLLIIGGLIAVMRRNITACQIMVGLTLIVLVFHNGIAQNISPNGSLTPATNSLPFSVMNQLAANTVGGNASNVIADVGAIPMLDCTTAAKALQWAMGSGFACNSAIDAATLLGSTWALPPAIGSGTPAAGAFSTLTVNGTLIKPILRATTGNIGGGLLAAGGCTSGTVSVTGATVGMVTAATPTTYPGDGVQYQSHISSANTVTVKVCVILLGTPTNTTYNVAVIQ